MPWKRVQRIQDIKSYQYKLKDNRKRRPISTRKCSSSPYPEKKEKCGVLSRKNDDTHPYDKQNTDTATKLNLPELEKSDRETGGTMLNVTGMNKFYYLRNFHDMRCKYERVLSIIHQQLNREPQEDEVFIVMSK